MKKIIAMLLAALLCFALLACDSGSSRKNDDDEIEELEEQIKDLEEEIEELKEELEEAEDDEDDDKIEELEAEIEEKEEELKELEEELEKAKEDSKKKKDDEDDDKKDKKSKKKGASAVVEDYYDALYSGDEDGVAELLLDEYAIAYLMDTNNFDDEDEVYEYVSEYFTGAGVDGAELEIDDEEAIEDGDFDDIVETLVDEYDYEEGAIEEAALVTYTVTAEYEGETFGIENETIVVKIDGTWYMTGMLWDLYY